MKIITSISSLQSATTDVCREFQNLGLYTEELHETDVQLSFAPWNYFEHGHYDGHAITVPAVSTAAAFGPYCSLRDTLRHEFGHVLLDHHPGLVTKAQWRKVFCAPQHEPTPYEYCEEDFITPYANSGETVEEDFCESLMVWVRHKGKIGRYRSSRPGAYEKLQFISELPKRIRKTSLAFA
ncbi:MAG: hypothetical protein HOE66_00505 [Planctomycetes bacterium]|jgi:hypothetical protein|nr:hypothetical protein [Planctomycetota bacterium]